MTEQEQQQQEEQELGILGVGTGDHDYDIVMTIILLNHLPAKLTRGFTQLCQTGHHILDFKIF